MAATVYYGEINCEAIYGSGAKKGEICRNKAYYEKGGRYLCGTHSRGDRVELPTNPNAKQLKVAALGTRLGKVLEKAEENRLAGRRGHVIVTKLKMMKPVEYRDGYRAVFPNYKHGNREDGYGCPALSPKSLGPVEHIMPNLPPAMNLENFHQHSKLWAFELDEEGTQKKEFFEARVRAYEDPTPHRHKYDRKTLKSYGHNVNIPAFSLFYKADGTACKFSYFGSRYFYCKKYEELAGKTKEIEQLRQWLREGMNLQIVGYDGYDVTVDLMQHYYDTSKPFGHELVLYTMLVVEDPKEYPWNVVYRSNLEMYEGVGI